MLFRSSKSNQETPKTKTSEKSAQNNTVNKPKIVKQKDKIVAGNSDKNKEKALITLKNRVQTLVALAPQLVLLLKQF